MNKSSDLTNIMSMPPSCWWEHAIVYHNQTIITIIVIFHLSLKITLRQEVLFGVLSGMSKKLELIRRKNMKVFSIFLLDIPDIIQITTKEMSTFPLLHVNFCWKGKFWIMVQYVYVEYIR